VLIFFIWPLVIRSDRSSDSWSISSTWHSSSSSTCFEPVSWPFPENRKFPLSGFVLRSETDSFGGFTLLCAFAWDLIFGVFSSTRSKSVACPNLFLRAIVGGARIWILHFHIYLVYSQIWQNLAKFSCGWSSILLQHKIGEKKKNPEFGKFSLEVTKYFFWRHI